MATAEILTLAGLLGGGLAIFGMGLALIAMVLDTRRQRRTFAEFLNDELARRAEGR